MRVASTFPQYLRLILSLILQCLSKERVPVYLLFVSYKYGKYLLPVCGFPPLF